MSPPLEMMTTHVLTLGFCRDASHHLGVAMDSIYRWIETRAMPVYRDGWLRKFKLSEVDEWVRAGYAVDKVEEPRFKEDTMRSEPSGSHR